MKRCLRLVGTDAPSQEGHQRCGDDCGVPQLVFPVVADFVESLMNATGVVAVARAGGAKGGVERAGGEPPYLVYYRGSLEAVEIRGLARWQGRERGPRPKAATFAPRWRVGSILQEN